MEYKIEREKMRQQNGERETGKTVRRAERERGEKREWGTRADRARL